MILADGGITQIKAIKAAIKEIEKETERLLREAGTTGVILGADCTVPKDIDVQRFNWVRDKAAALQ